MPVQFQNYAYKYERNGKPIFAPSGLGQQIGKDVKAQVEAAYAFDDFIYHLRKKGGHVAALHAHRPHEFFARVDIRRFFYSIARNRVARALRAIGVTRAEHYAKWSCVKNPHAPPAYALPYGFIQSPALATLVLMQSGVGDLLRELVAQGEVMVTVYMDDISLSSDNLTALQAAFDRLLACLQHAEFEISPEKTRHPSPAMDLFNCDVECGRTVVRSERIDLFLSEPRTLPSQEAFDGYCESVAAGNA
jgi:hypothetical protein